MSADVRPEHISEIASIFAKGYLRYKKSRQNRLPDSPQDGVDSDATQSVHVTVVNAQRTEEN
jgi:hypothetical protein